MFHYRQALHQMQQGLSDRAIAKGGMIGRLKAGQLRLRASDEGWLKPGAVRGLRSLNAKSAVREFVDFQ